MAVNTLRRSLPILLFAVSAQSAFAACPTPVRVTTVLGTLDRAEKAYAELDLDGFLGYSDMIREDVPCLSDPLSPSLAGRLHRLEGLRAFVDRNQRASQEAFAAARSADPEYFFPESLIPAGYPELENYEAIPLELGAYEQVPAPKSGTVRFDGAESLDRPTAWPAIMQLLDVEGDVTATTYLWRDTPLPEYVPAQLDVASASGDFFNAAIDDDFDDVFGSDFNEPKDDDPPVGTTTGDPLDLFAEDDPPPRRTTSSSNLGSTTPNRTGPDRRSTSSTRSFDRDDDRGAPGGWIATGVVAAVASGTSYYLASRAASNYRDPATGYDELNDLRLQANLWSGVAGGTGILAITSGIMVGVRW